MTDIMFDPYDPEDHEDPLYDEGALHASDHAFQYPTWACRVSSTTDATLPGALGSDPPRLKEDVSTKLKPVKVSRSAGGHQLDYVDVVWIEDAPLTERMEQPVAFSKMVDVLFPNSSTIFDIPFGDGFIRTFIGEGNTRAALGDYLCEDESVDRSETLTGRVELRPYHFGKVFRGMTFLYNNTAEVITRVGSDMVFNPMVDGTIRGNRSSSFYTFAYHWIDPEISESPYSLDFHNQTASEWSLFDAINIACKVCNSDEFFIRNPTLVAEDDMWTDAPPLKDVNIESGRYLPYYLDELLHPLGYNWFVDPDTGLDGAETETDLKYLKPQIKIFRKGFSDVEPKSLKFQAPGETLDLSLSDLNEYAISRRIGDACTAARVLGDKMRVEVTIPLYPGWKADSDPLTVEDLTIDDGAAYPDNMNVHRLWVGNEGAGFTGLRESPSLYPIGDPPDFSEIFTIVDADDNLYETKTIARKRPMEPPLTYQGNETERVRRDLFLEYSTDAGGTYIEVTDKIGSWSVMGDQIAIRFGGNKPPAVLVDAFLSGDLRMRITGTIASDHCIYNAGTDGYTELATVQGRENLITLQQQDRYRHWFVLGKDHPARPALDSHAFRSVLRSDPAGADTHDDRAALRTFAERIIKTMVHAEYDGSFVLPGWHTDYKISDLLTHIDGRNVTLNQSADPDSPQYMQITGIEWSLSDEDGPSTRLIVDRGTKTYIDNAPRGRNAPVQVAQSEVPDHMRFLAVSGPDVRSIQSIGM